MQRLNKKVEKAPVNVVLLSFREEQQGGVMSRTRFIKTKAMIIVVMIGMLLAALPSGVYAAGQTSDNNSFAIQKTKFD